MAGIMDEVRRALLSGASQEELVSSGYNKKTVYMVAYKLKEEGLLGSKGEPLGRIEDLEIEPEAPVITHKGKQRVEDDESPQRASMVKAKPSSLEALVNSFLLPESASFEDGVKTGIHMTILGVRIAQELSTIGINQARPLLQMAQDMRKGEEVASKRASSEAAEEAAARVYNMIAPMLAEREKPTPVSTNPFMDMMARSMEPVIKKIMGSFVGVQPDSSSMSAPHGWSVREE